MRWLKNQMAALDPPATNFTDLAKRLKQGDPSLPSKESLAIYLSHLDKGDPSALRKHPKAWGALADLLGLSVEELDAQFDPNTRGAIQRNATRLELWDVDARPLELREEPLPPGIPTEVQDPRGWPCWWLAPSGSGRTLVGQWLEARGLATFIQARTWSEARKRLPQRGAIFVELTGEVREDVPPTPPSRSLCIAAGWEPPAPPADENDQPVSSPWPLVECAPVENWLEALVAWLEPRLDPEDDFDREACLRWLRDNSWAKSALDGFGSVLGLVGLFAKHGAKGTHDAAPEQLIRRFLRLRLDRLASAGNVLRRDALDKGLQRIARGLLLDGEHPPWESRPLEHWYALARGAGPDARWLREAGSLGLETAAVQRASQNLPPDGFEVVQSLRTLHLLRETRSAGLELRPSWLLEASLEGSAARMTGEEPGVWGAALLLPPCSDYVVDALIVHFRDSNFGSLSRLLNAPAPAAPEWVAALEGAFLALGMAVLEGIKAPANLARELYEWQRRLMLQGPEGPEAGRALPRRRILRQTHLVAEGMWYLAALALSEFLGKDVPPLHSRLDPWERAPAEKTRPAQEEGWTALQAPAMAPWRAGAFDLGDRLFERGEPARPISWLQFPAFLRQSFRRGSLQWLPKAPWKVLMPELPSYLERHGESWRDFSKALWKAWLTSSHGFPSAFSPHHPWAESLWEVLPPEAVADERFQDVLSNPRVPYERFGPEHWRAFLTLWPKRREDFMSVELGRMHAWHHIPREHALAAILQGVAADSHVREVLLQRFPELTLEELRASLARADWKAARWLVQEAPAEHAEALLEALVEEVHRREAAVPGWLGQFLHELVMERGAHWRKAWEWFARLVPAEGGRPGGGEPHDGKPSAGG